MHRRVGRLSLLSAVLLAASVVSVSPTGAATGSSCVAMTAPAVSTSIQLSEVEADPVLGGTDTRNEWLELANVGSSAITLADWTVTDNGGTDPVPTVTLAPGKCVVLAASSEGFLAEHAGYANPFLTLGDGAIGNGLSNGGDSVLLKDAGGTVIDCVVWGSGTGCFAPAAGASPANTGETLQRSGTADSDTAADWAVAAATPCGSTTAVMLMSFRASLSGGRRVVLAWRTAAEEGQLGFNVWRSGSRQSGYRRVNPRLIAARAVGLIGGAEYRYDDLAPAGRRTLFYRLQLIDAAGRSSFSRPLRVRG